MSLSKYMVVCVLASCDCPFASDSCRFLCMWLSVYWHVMTLCKYAVVRVSLSMCQ